MQQWETPFMAELAKVAASLGGRVLEVGFGMGISAKAMQQHPVAEHLIMEANETVFKQLQTFKANSRYPVTPIGPLLWQDSLHLVPDDSIDGILYDTYPLVKEEQHIHQFNFIEQAYKKLRPGGILTYCNLTSIGVLSPMYDSWDALFRETQLPHLLKCGFAESDIHFTVFPVSPPADCDYYQHKTAMVPVCRKSSKPKLSPLDEKASEEQVMLSSYENGVHHPNTEIPGEVYSAEVVRATRRVEILKNAAVQLVQAEEELASMKALESKRRAKLSSMANGDVVRRVNAWTQWGTLKEIVVGVADMACYIPKQPASHPTINQDVENGENVGGTLDENIDWPRGPKKQAVIDAANVQLDNLSTVLEDRGIRVLRPNPSIDWSIPLATPFFNIPHQYCSTCGRDSVITLGNIVLEASMSRRDRYFEVMAYRDIISDLHQIDKNMLWKAAPKPTMRDEMYNEEWWDLKLEERYKRMHSFSFCVTEDEPVFDAADITRCGKDIFAQLSMTCNRAGIEWLRRELAPHGFRVHMLRFPYDLAPSHMDCTFVPLRSGLVLTNPDRPCLEEDLKIFRDNDWRFIECPPAVNPVRPWGSQSSKWLSMNILSIAPNVAVVEEQETDLQRLLESEGIEVIAVPFRDVYEFGGGLHCATWDIERDDSMGDFFPIQDS